MNLRQARFPAMAMGKVQDGFRTWKEATSDPSVASSNGSYAFSRSVSCVACSCNRSYRLLNAQLSPEHGCYD